MVRLLGRFVEVQDRNIIEQVPEGRRKQTYEWQTTQTLSRGNDRVLQVTSASTEQQHLLAVRHESEVSMYRLEGCVGEHEIKSCVN